MDRPRGLAGTHRGIYNDYLGDIGVSEVSHSLCCSFRFLRFRQGSVSLRSYGGIGRNGVGMGVCRGFQRELSETISTRSGE